MLCRAKVGDVAEGRRRFFFVVVEKRKEHSQFFFKSSELGSFPFLFCFLLREKENFKQTILFPSLLFSSPPFHSCSRKKKNNASKNDPPGLFPDRRRRVDDALDCINGADRSCALQGLPGYIWSRRQQHGHQDPKLARGPSLGEFFVHVEGGGEELTF